MSVPPALTFSQRQVEGVFDLLDLGGFLDALQLVPQLPQLDVEVDFVLSSGELGAARAGRRHQVQSLRREEAPEGQRFTTASPVHTHVERSLLPGVALATMLVKPILYLTGRVVSCMWLSCSFVKPDRKRHFPEMEKSFVSLLSSIFSCLPSAGASAPFLGLGPGLALGALGFFAGFAGIGALGTLGGFGGLGSLGALGGFGGFGALGTFGGFGGFGSLG
ncbi:hypothetical protein EYF80_048034 [Liparis tanakae]|uniref:Uncharacterized protein n=1 Tax=Liparis tanakae TaxID=230148 RepID=A0A4Z2FKU7_9TELE|nr:hypothetical protein EYF80_048034 [Liparis tanakae]